MSSSSFAAFWAVSFLFVITPGVDWAYAISAGMRGRVVVPAVTGLLLGHLTATVIVAVGVGSFVAHNPTTLAVLTTVGALYLLWLGINMLIRPPQPGAVERPQETAMPFPPRERGKKTWGGPSFSCETQESDSWARWTIKGAGVSGLNPKVFLLFLALLPQFTDPAAAWSVPVQIVALGLVHICSCGVVYLLVGFGSQTLLRTRPRAAQIVSRISGAAMTAIAVLLFAEQVIR